MRPYDPNEAKRSSVRWWRRIGLISAATMAAVAVAVFFDKVWCDTRPSDIIAFKPADFRERAESPFFYVIGRTLRHSDSIDPKGKPILEGQIKRVLVAPDAKHAAVVADDHLIVISSDGSLSRKITTVSSTCCERKPHGRFALDNHFQWSSDSKHLYYITDEYAGVHQPQLVSEQGKLWVYDVATAQSRQIVSPFRDYRYFLTANGGIYFSELDGKHNLVRKYFDGTKVHTFSVTQRRDESSLFAGDLGPVFYSFASLNDNVFRSKGVYVERKSNGTQSLVFKGKAMIAATLSKHCSKPFGRREFGCLDLAGAAFLPGDRYLRIDLRCGNYEGQLLIDIANGIYKTLPKETRVYPMLNTNTVPRYRIMSYGIEL